MKKLLKLALIVGVLAGLAKLVAGQMAKWQGLTESEVRDKLESRLPKRIPDEKRAEITDKIVTGMREQGAILDEDETSVGAPADSGGGGEEPDSDDAKARQDSGDITASV